MLLNLTITNFAIIDRLEVQFDQGFNVLTGETGAGKSIILDAFGLLLGDRARPDLVRSGEAEATVEALFDLAANERIRQAFADAGFSFDEELVLRRVVTSAGRSRAYVNGAMATLAQLKPLAELLVAVCGQHEHQTLAQRTAQQNILDLYGGLLPLLQSYRSKFKLFQQSEQQLGQLEGAERDRQQRLDFLRHQSEEIAAANVSLDEEEELVAERLLLQNAERLSAATQNGYEGLYGEEGAVCERLGSIADALGGVSEVDAELASHAETAKRCLYELEDVAAQLRSHLERIRFDPARLEEIENRLAELTRLKRKYAPTLTEVLEQQATFDEEIAALENAEATREGLAAQLQKLEGEVAACGEKLSQARREAAAKLETAVRAELDGLAMSGAALKVAFEALSQPGAGGLDRIEFLVSTNPGEPPMALGKVASGGELSRLMLALKRLAPEADGVPTLIFDEVDAGIGGAAATAVGKKLQGVSRSAQTLCVTHLPQVAAFADHHHRVLKREVSGRTLTDMAPLLGDDRVQEMARMLGGAQITEQTLLHARELIESSASL
ncbi:MAG: DNA repair protein RecN [Desulfuromonadales bacterium]|nr:DNA repair protein RecN [Desulfuromonadales bacterium]